MHQLTHTLLSATVLHKTITGVPTSPELVNRLKVWGAGIFRLVVIGEINKGKSSFINALLNTPNLVPVADTVATSTVFKIHYAEQQSYRVHFLKYLNRPAIDIAADELAAYGTESGNPGNEKEVDFIEVTHPSPMLKAGLVVIDTPGLGGIIQSHQRITWQYVPHADAAVFVTDGNAPLGYADLEYLRSVRNITPHIFFVQTKSSASAPDAIEKRADNNKNIIAEDWGIPREDIRYFTADSTLYFMGSGKNKALYQKASGYPLILEYFQNTLLPDQHILLADRAVQSISPLIREITQNLQSRKDNLAADTEEKRSVLMEELRRVETALQEWHSYKQSDLCQKLNSRIRKIHQSCIDMCNELRPNDSLHQSFDDTINACNSCNALTTALSQINEQIAITLSEKITAISRKAHSGIRAALCELAEATELSDADLDINEPDTRIIGQGRAYNTAIQRSINYFQQNNNSFHMMRSVLFGAGAGASIGSLVGGALGSVIPIIGNIAGHYVGMTLASVWCGKKMLSVTQESVLSRYRAQAIQAISQACMLMHTDLTQNISRMFGDFGESFNSAITKALRQRNTTLTAQRNELIALKRNDAKQHHTLQEKLRQDETALQTILNNIQTWWDTKQRT